MNRKPFLPINKQVDLLESRGLLITDKDAAFKFLYDNNYYRVSGYALTLKETDKFFADTHLEDIMSIYYFDQELRTLLLKYLLLIEEKVKSQFAYEYAKKLNPYSYRDASNYTNQPLFTNTIKKIDNVISSASKYELSLKHHYNNGLTIPIWLYIEYASFTDVSILYKILDNENIKNTIAKNNGYKKNNFLSNNLRCLSQLRNFCAHGYRLYNRTFSYKPKLTKKDKGNTD